LVMERATSDVMVPSSQITVMSPTFSSPTRIPFLSEQKETSR
jgi:hypothetical protein